MTAAETQTEELHRHKRYVAKNCAEIPRAFMYVAANEACVRSVWAGEYVSNGERDLGSGANTVGAPLPSARLRRARGPVRRTARPRVRRGAPAAAPQSPSATLSGDVEREKENDHDLGPTVERNTIFELET